MSPHPEPGFGQENRLALSQAAKTINQRRSDKQLQEAKTKTAVRKMALQVKRQQTMLIGGLFNMLVDAETVLVVYKAYY